jgi:hypothetical protein
MGCAHALCSFGIPVAKISSGNPAKQAEHDQAHQNCCLITHFPKTIKGLRKNWHLFKVVNFEGCPGV